MTVNRLCSSGVKHVLSLGYSGVTWLLVLVRVFFSMKPEFESL